MKRCKFCGCYLDPGEWCDCQDEEEQDVDEQEARRPSKVQHPSVAERYARYLGIDKEVYLR